MENNKLLDLFGKPSTIKVIGYLLFLDGEECTIKCIMDVTELSRNSVDKAIDIFKGLKIVKTRTIGKNIMCRIDQDEKLIKLLIEMNMTIKQTIRDRTNANIN